MEPPTSRTLLDVLGERFPDSSKGTLRKMLEANRVCVNGSPERNAKRPITSGDRIEVGSKRAALDPRVTILHEDAELIVIDKAAGLLTVPSSAPVGAEETVVGFLGAYLGVRRGEEDMLVVHRLDRASSGVLVFAKNPAMRDRLKVLLAAHDVERIYVAIIHGRLPEPTGTIRSRMVEDDALHMKSIASARGGKKAITHYRTLESGARYSMLEVTLETGRRNQIRVHLAEAGHPIVGDTMYGAGRENPLGRLGLHAAKLGFKHPRTGRNSTFTSPIPEVFRQLKLSEP